MGEAMKLYNALHASLFSNFRGWCDMVDLVVWLSSLKQQQGRGMPCSVLRVVMVFSEKAWGADVLMQPVCILECGCLGPFKQGEQTLGLLRSGNPHKLQRYLERHAHSPHYSHIEPPIARTCHDGHAKHTAMWGLNFGSYPTGWIVA